MILKKNLKFFHLSIICKIRQENMFDDIRERKKACLDFKIRRLKKLKNQDFSMILVKNLKFFHLFSLG